MENQRDYKLQKYMHDENYILKLDANKIHKILDTDIQDESDNRLIMETIEQENLLAAGNKEENSKIMNSDSFCLRESFHN